MEKHSVLPFTLAVLMQRVALNNRWQAYRWKPLEILADAQPGGARVLIAGEAEQRWLFPGFAVHLHADETPVSYTH
ncbi:DUF3305 domain-containing protein, partial [Sphingomonas sp. 10B4]|uniref:DUF3305 domain-containing protein n=1 Tax=Sphingomonas sp. 10B4 TaxID=3048575 RepID=UPI002B221ED6